MGGRMGGFDLTVKQQLAERFLSRAGDAKRTRRQMKGLSFLCSRLAPGVARNSAARAGTGARLAGAQRSQSFRHGVSPVSRDRDWRGCHRHSGRRPPRSGVSRPRGSRPRAIFRASASPRSRRSYRLAREANRPYRIEDAAADARRAMRLARSRARRMGHRSNAHHRNHGLVRGRRIGFACHLQRSRRRRRSARPGIERVSARRIFKSSSTLPYGGIPDNSSPRRRRRLSSSPPTTISVPPTRSRVCCSSIATIAAAPRCTS